jgi:hypothetical protein
VAPWAAVLRPMVTMALITRRLTTANEMLSRRILDLLDVVNGCRLHSS